MSVIDERKLFEEFQKIWTLEKVKNMTLEEYTQLGSKETFTYWFEHKLSNWGSVKGVAGGLANLKSWICHCGGKEYDIKRKVMYSSDRQYVWLAQCYDKDNNPFEAFKEIRNKIIEVIRASQNNDLDKIETIKLEGMLKWKIAFHYQNPNNMKIFCIFSKGVLKRIAERELDNGNLPTSQIYTQLMSDKKYTLETSIQERSKPLWKKYGNENDKDDENEGDTMPNTPTPKNPPLNQILYGPPGTGKTYNTINKALEILGVETQGKSRAELKAKFDEFRQNGQIEFVTFHQSFSYEEFVEGIKPKFINSNEGAESSKMEYEIKSGIFKQICDRAKQYTKEFVIDQQVVKPYVLDKNKTLWRLYTLPDAKIDNDFFDECIKDGCVKAYYDYGGVALNKAENGDYIVIPSTNYGEMSKTIRAFGILRDNDIKQTKENEIYYKNVEWLWVAKDENEIIRFDKVNFNRPVFQRVKQGKESIIDYMNILLDKNKESFTTKPYILIIDEINRGNISKILGELITLIEPSKRIGGDEELRVTLPYSNESFGVPSNLYIIGTMNTADRSIALLDTALRRRFEFVEMMPECDNKNISTNCEGVNLQALLKCMNDRIEFLLDREHTIGHSFFINVNSLSELQQVFKNKIIPLLQEYFYDDYAKIDAVLNGNGMIEPKKDSTLEKLFDTNFKSDLDSEKVVYQITNSNKWNEKNFLRIYDSSVQIDKDE